MHGRRCCRRRFGDTAQRHVSVWSVLRRTSERRDILPLRSTCFLALVLKFKVSISIGCNERDRDLPETRSTKPRID